MKNKIFCFTHKDLDGAISYLLLKWTFPTYNIEHQTISNVYTARADISKWLLNNNFEDYRNVYFLDLDVSESSDLIDKENTIIIDHHDSHIENKACYEKATLIMKKYPSACMLMYKVFKKLYGRDYTDAQKALVVLGNDYDSYQNKFADSKLLNIIFWNTQKTFDAFVSNYQDGYREFTKEQKAICDISIREFQKIKEKLQIYVGEYRGYKTYATFAENYINEVADELLQLPGAEIAVVVNKTAQKVSYRRIVNCEAKINMMAMELSDGGGHEQASGGPITDNFLEFTKTLNPYERNSN